MFNKLNILLIPLDNRPVSYCIPKELTDINNSINITLPPRKIIGGLTVDSDMNSLFDWLKLQLELKKIDIIICCLDTIAYGGLISSRRSNDRLKDVENRLVGLKHTVKEAFVAPVVYAFSSIMRISNNNINEEEKLYWSEFGELIFKYSSLTHKSKLCDVGSELSEVKKKIPDNILKDYLKTRERNFIMNKRHIDSVREGILDYLVLSQDDTAEFGLNVQEKNELQKIIDEFKLKNVVVKTGADEIPSSLMTRSILAFSKITPSVYPLFFDENSKNIISRYEDITIENSVNGQITLSGAKVAENIEEADLVMVVNAPLKTQDDLCMKVFNDENNEEQTNKICDFIKNNSRPFFIADIKNANGGDDLLMDKLLTSDFDKSLLYGYSGWNTTGNTLGSTLSIALSRFISEKTDNFNEEMFKKALFVRLMDDWIYQSIVRQTIRDKGDMSILTDEMNKYVQKIADFVGFKPKDVKFSYPWDRTFEIEISVEN